MKKLILFFLLIGCLQVAVAQTKDLDPVKVPKAVIDNFNKDNPGITPAWKADGKNFKAIFTDPKTKLGQMIVYDNKGAVLRKENELDKTTPEIK